MKLIRLDQAI